MVIMFLVEFTVDEIRDIEWNTKAFDSLALPGNHKSLLMAFARSQQKAGAQFDDVIQGKGELSSAVVLFPSTLVFAIWCLLCS